MAVIKKEILSDNTNITANSKQLEILKQNFPNCFDKNGAFIPHKMAEIVGKSELDLSRESYSLNWLGKSYARLLANENPQTLLKEDKEHNAKEENCESQNLLIKGDNLEVLKHLKNAYGKDGGQIKMIYIDPPYNTGSDGFVYNDDRKFTPEQLVTLAGIELDEAKRILEFTQSKSNSHSAWLTFIYPRLYVARELLKNDGVIFVSIDDNEVSQLKLLCDEVFGEENFVANVPTIMNLKGNQDNFGFADTHEYFLVYAKNKNYCVLNKFEVDEEEIEKDWDEDEYGLFKKADGLRRTGDDASRDKRPKGWFPIFITKDDEIYVTDSDNPNSSEDYILYPINDDGEELSWSWSKKKIINETYNLIITGGNETKNIYKKQRPELGDLPTKKPKSFFYKSAYSTSTATTQLKNLLGKKVFKAPKPVPFIQDLIIIGSNENDIILDFFAGSGTTADAIINLNRHSGNRKFITVQLPEAINSVNEKAAYEFVKKELKKNEPTIFDITKFRIEKAAAKIKLHNPNYQGDLGFKIFETIPLFDGYLDEMENLDDGLELYDGSKLNETELGYLLTTWKTYDGIALTEDLHPIKFADYQAYTYEKNVYFMEKNFTSEALSAFIKALDEDPTFQPSKLILFGYNFQSKFLRETAEGLKSYKNKKSIELDVVVRY